MEWCRFRAMRVMRACAVVVFVLGIAGQAWADDPAVVPQTSAAAPPPTPPPAPARQEPRSTDHYRQFGLSGRIAIGLRGIATYDDVDYCGKRSPDTGSGFSAVCIGRAPISLDLEASYGVAHRMEAILEFRLGLERDFGSIPGV